MKILKNNFDIVILLCLFIVIQPFLDISILYTNDKLSIFGITIPTIVRTLFIGIIGLIIYIKSENKKEKISIFIYFIILGIYSIIHHIVTSGNISIHPNFRYSLFSEVFYIIRMILPLLVIYITKNTKITYDKFIKCLLYSSVIIGLVIVISNTLKISPTSYGTKLNRTQLSWISWIFGDISLYKFEELTSKGWFYMANQVSGLTLLLLPFCISDLLKKANFLNILATSSLTLAMIILGTRVSSMGFLLVYILMIIVSIFLYILKFSKELNKKSVLILIILTFIFGFLLSISPSGTRTYTKNLKPTLPSEELDEIELSDVYIYRYIMDNYPGYGIQKVYIEELYDYKYDYQFWLDIFKKSVDHILDNREIEYYLTKRIASKNNNELKYELFGYSFSRMRNGQIYLEEDILVQKFTMGYIGLILLIFPYIISIIYIVIIYFKNKKINLDLATFGLSMCATFGAAIFSGHIFDELFVTIYLAFIIGYYLITIKRKELTK